MLSAEISDEALRLRNLGLAELENEQPAKAAEHFSNLAELTPSDPMPLANLAIAGLRQQRFDQALSWIDKALAVAPGQPELLTIRAEILQWSGQPEAALPIFVEAAASAPENVEIQYALTRQASSLPGPQAAEAKRVALERLRTLRPENLVVLMQSGQELLAAGDRAGATGVFLRVEEVLWQAPAAAMKLLEQILAALEANDFEAARVPALRLENVVKITPMFKEGLRELSPGIQGVPLTRFRQEPPASAFGEPLEVRFSSRSLSEIGTTPDGLALGDFDGDQKTDWARLTTAAPATLEVWLAAVGEEPAATHTAAGAQGLVTADLDNDGNLDLIAHGADAIMVLRGSQTGTFVDATAEFGIGDSGAAAVAVLDFDMEGDLDLATAGGREKTAEMFRNSLRGPLEAVGDRTFPNLEIGSVRDLLASDLDRDGDVDLLLAHEGGLVWLDNLRQGQFADRTAAGGLLGVGSVNSVVSSDLDNDGLPDLVTAGTGISFLHNRGGRFESWKIAGNLRTSAEFSALGTFDADNDGRLDLAVGGASGLTVLGQRSGLEFSFLKIDSAPTRIDALESLDLDQDCDLDLVAGGPAGLWRFENVGGDKNDCLTVRLQGLDKGNSKNNIFGFGSTVEVRSGDAYQMREVFSDANHLGLGDGPKADLLRVVWPNGVPQNRLQPTVNQRIVEEQVLKGSCPFLYAGKEGGVEFVTDLLWGAPIGLPVAPGKWASTDPQELVKLPGVEALRGRYDLRITEELWEAAFFDFVRLWVVDHPAEVEVASNLRIVPGESLPERVLGTRDLRPLKAFDDRFDITKEIADRDEIYASPWQKSPYQGVAAEPWTLTLDLGVAPDSPVRLHLDGWIFPTDASLNLALAQQRDLATWPPRLEVETGGEWRVLMPSMGFPAGKTKTMVVDTPPLPANSRRLRIVGTQWLSYDRIVWSVDPADEEPRVVARLEPQTAELRFRGFSRMYRATPNGPHVFDYAAVRTASPWLPLPGRYTRFGDVRELLRQADDRSVILAPGDEMALIFDAGELPAIPSGWHRTVFLESHGWDKDADRNTGAGQQLEPLPFRAMTTYPYGPDERFPDSDLHREYLETWLTRIVRPALGALPRTSP